MDNVVEASTAPVETSDTSLLGSTVAGNVEELNTEVVTQTTESTESTSTATTPSEFTMDQLLSTLDDETKASPSWEKFKNPADVAKSYLELQKMVGHKGDFVGEDATPEEFQEMWSKLGKPKDVAGYDIKVPEEFKMYDGATERATKAMEIAHEANLTKAQADKLFTGLFEMEANDISNATAFETQKLEESRDALKAEWGNDIEPMSNEVLALQQKLGMYDLLEKSGANDNPSVLIAFGKIASELGETSTIENAIASTPAGVENEIAELNAQVGEFMRKGQQVPQHIQTRLQDAFSKLG